MNSTDGKMNSTDSITSSTDNRMNSTNSRITFYKQIKAKIPYARRRSRLTTRQREAMAQWICEAERLWSELWKRRIKLEIIPKKSYKILDKRKILWYNKSR